MPSGQWGSSDRRARLPKEWHAMRARTRRRATETDPLKMPGGRCEHVSPETGRCLTVGSQCDHINRGDDHGEHNRQWLCVRHHAEKTQREAQEARAAKAARGKRTPERHPGSIRRRTP